MNITDDLKENFRRYYTSLGLKNVEGYVARRLNRERSKRIISFISKETPIDFSSSSVLDIGSGWGEFLLTLKEAGFQKVHGVEPDPELVVLSNQLAGANTAVHGMAEVLPFDSATFNLVICNDVIEHVMHCDIALAEMIRVTKVGGMIWLGFPNYAYPQESHYKMFFPPFLPKLIGAFYLRLVGRNPSFYCNNVRPTYYHRVMRTLNLFDIAWKEVHDTFYGITLGKGIKGVLKRWYIKYFGPPAVSLLITKNGTGLKTASVDFVQGKDS